MRHESSSESELKIWHGFYYVTNQHRRNYGSDVTKRLTEAGAKSFHEKAGMSQVGFVFLVLSNPCASNRSASAAILPSALFS